MPTLTVQDAHPPASFQFDNTIVIGRGGTADFVVPAPSVSRRHAMVLRDGDWWFVEDLGSGNGTFLNGRKVSQRAPLKAGDQLRLGSAILQFRDTLPTARSAPVATIVRMMDSEPGPRDQVLARVPVADQSEPNMTLVGSARRLRLLENLARISSMVFDERALLSFVIDELLDLIPRADRAFVMLWDPELKRLVPNAARTRSRTAVEILASRTLLDDVLNRREAVLVLDTASDERYAKSESIYALRIRTAICTPIVFQDQIFGVIQIDSAAEGAAFNRGDLVLSVGLCAEVGMALAYARVHEQLVEQKLLEHDLDLARKIQHRFMPAMPPSVEGYSFSVEFTPALAVGGDLYDFMELGDGLTAVVIGDVSGKGVSAALFCAKLMTDLRYVSKGLTSPAAILSRVNDVLALGDHEGMFVTAAITVLNSRSGQFTIANAGHPLPFARDHAGRVEAVGRTDGPAVGLTPGARFRDHTYQLDAGDVLVFYTDGIVEALNPQKAMFGEPALLESIRGSDGSPRDIVRTIAGRVRTFAAGEPQSDDLTIISVARH